MELTRLTLEPRRRVMLSRDLAPDGPRRQGGAQLIGEPLGTEDSMKRALLLVVSMAESVASYSAVEAGIASWSHESNLAFAVGDAPFFHLVWSVRGDEEASFDP
jgi:hypothetical protein